tara:strand:- start:533 stop:1354 length:822 start_codon:yes stop_codon:yes gene_type:complete
MKFSVVVCGKNEEKKINKCLNSIIQNRPDEIIFVDGNSTDKTVDFVKNFTDKIFVRKNSNLTNDRQFGIDNCKNELIVMIDCDHILRENDIKNLINDLFNFKFDLIQSQLEIYEKKSLMSLAENQSYQVVHNIPGRKKMIGVAPAVFKKEIFSKVRFDDHITKTIDDTDFIYRLREKNYLFGIGNVKIYQDHNSSITQYLKKFLWYGKGDGEFIQKNPDQFFNMFYHLLIRYNFIYFLKSLFKFKLIAIPFFWIQSFTRIIGIIYHFISLVRK